MTAPICTFAIRPEPGSRLSVGVEVFATVRAFRRHVREQDRKYRLSPSRTRGLVGQCVGVTVRNRRSQRKAGLFAVIRLPKQHLTMSTITHEAFHATMRWAERRRIHAIPTTGNVSNMRRGPMAHSLEERCAMVHDTICRRIVVELQRRRLLPA